MSMARWHLVISQTPAMTMTAITVRLSQQDAHDDADLGFDASPSPPGPGARGPGQPARALDPLAAFLKELEDLDSMSCRTCPD